MVHLTDELLMAYADGELDAAMRAEVEAAIALNPQMRERLHRFVNTGAPVAALYEWPAKEPAPQHIRAMIMGDAPLEQQPRRGFSILNKIAVLHEMLFPGPAWANALAWSLPVLLVGVGAFWYAGRSGDGLQELVAVDNDQIFARGALKRALETAPSGSLTSFGQGQSALSMEAVLTFKNRHQEFCRQYGVTTPQGNYAGVACRGSHGEWRIEVHTAATSHVGKSNKAAPVGRATSSVEAAVSNAIEGDALGREDEEALIGKAWRR